MVLTKLAVLLATSLADWTKCLLATGLVVLEEARRQVLHSDEVCLATMVAAESTCHVTNNEKSSGYRREIVMQIMRRRKCIKHPLRVSRQHVHQSTLRIKVKCLFH